MKNYNHIIKSKEKEIILTVIVIIIKDLILFNIKTQLIGLFLMLSIYYAICIFTLKDPGLLPSEKTQTGRGGYYCPPPLPNYLSS